MPDRDKTYALVAGRTDVPQADDRAERGGNWLLTKQLYTVGETAFVPVLVAQQTYFESQLAYMEALTELHKVVIEINGLQLTGGLNPAAIGSASKTSRAVPLNGSGRCSTRSRIAQRSNCYRRPKLDSDECRRRFIAQQTSKINRMDYAKQIALPAFLF